MVEAAAHLIENVIPCIPMRQWVISFPKRLRCYLETHAILQDILRLVVDEVRKKLISCSPKVTNVQFGAVSFMQRFGNTLNVHPHFHLVVAVMAYLKLKMARLNFIQLFSPPTILQM